MTSPPKKPLWEKVFNLAGGIAALLAILGVVVSLGQYWKERETRRRVAVFSAWGVVSSTEGKRADGGRTEAIRQLRGNHQSLEGLVLDGAVLANLDLSGEDLTFASLKNVALTQCNFSNAKLISVTLSNATFRENCNFQASIIDKADLRKTSFYAVHMNGAVLSDVVGDDDTTFSEAGLDAASFSNSSLQRATFDGAELPHASFLNVKMEESRFLKSKMEHCRMTRVSADRAQFRGSVSNGCIFEDNSSLRSTDFVGAKLAGASFSDVTLDHASFFGADLAKAVFKNCSLVGADFTSADLTYARFQNCDLTGANFQSATIPDIELFKDCKGRPINDWRSHD